MAGVLEDRFLPHSPRPLDAPASGVIAGIDLVRFVAATLVVLWHFGAKPFIDPTGSTLRALLPAMEPRLPQGWQVTSFGWIGVEIFFVVSGAVIALSAQKATPRSFAIGRFVRLWPAMAICALLCTVISVLFWHVGPGQALVRLVSSLVFSPKGPWFSGQVWTLPVEIAFYALTFGMIVLGRGARLDLLAALLTVWSGAYWVIATMLPQPLGPSWLTALLLCQHGCYFALGIVILRIGRGQGDWLAYLIGGLCLIIAYAEISARTLAELGTGVLVPSAADPYLMWLAAVVLILLSVGWQGPISRLIGRASGSFRTVGAMTYPLYLVHYQAGGLLFYILWEQGLALWANLAVTLAAVIALAWLLTIWVEKPFSKEVKRLLEGMEWAGRWPFLKVVREKV